MFAACLALIQIETMNIKNAMEVTTYNINYNIQSQLQHVFVSPYALSEACL